MAPEAGKTPPARASPLDRLAGRASGALAPVSRRSVVSQTALQLSVQDVLDGRVLQRQVRVHPFQLRVLSLELAQALHVRDRRATVLASPLEERRLADPVLPCEIRDRDAALCVLEHRDDLRLTELRLPHD